MPKQDKNHWSSLTKAELLVENARLRERLAVLEAETPTPMTGKATSTSSLNGKLPKSERLEYRRIIDAIESFPDGFALYDAEDKLVICNSNFKKAMDDVEDILVPGVSYETVHRTRTARGKRKDGIKRDEAWIQERIELHQNPKGPLTRKFEDGRTIQLTEFKTSDGGIAMFRVDVTELTQAQVALQSINNELEQRIAERTAHLEAEIEERRKLEGTMRVSEARLQNILNNSPTPIYFKDTEARFVIANRQFEEFYSVRFEDIEGKSPIDMYPNEKGEAFYEFDMEVINEHKTVVQEELIDGKTFITTKFPVIDDSGKLIGLGGVEVNITDRKEAEEEIRKSKDHLNTAVESLNEGFAYFDGKDRLIVCNQKFREIRPGNEDRVKLGMTFEELTKIPVEVGQDYDGQARDEAWIKTRLEQHRSPKGPLYRTLNDGRTIQINEIKTRDGGTAITRTDITDLENARLDAEAASKAKSEFLSVVSHELRTPLTSIKGSLSFLVGGHLGNLSEKAMEMIAMAYRNTNRLIGLVNDILDMEKIASGGMEFTFLPMNLSNLVEEAVESNKGYADANGVKFIMMAPSSDIFVNGDADRLTQVIANLLSNAAKFSPENGEVRVSVTRIDNVARVEITDKGLGIPEKYREHIFGRFTQVDSSHARQKGGTGLGLNISKTIIEMHDGEIDYTSEVGVGSTFFVTLPVSA